MIVEKILIRKQTPTEPTNWLYKYDKDTNTYILTKCAYLKADEDMYLECTEEQKLEFDKYNAEIEQHEECIK